MAALTLTTLLASCYQRLGWGTTPETDATTRTTQFITDTLYDLFTRPGIRKLRRVTIPFTTVEGSPYAGLPASCTRVVAILDATNNRKLNQVSVDWIDARDPGRAFSSSSPVAWALQTLTSPVQRQPENVGACTVVSSSASDTTQVIVWEIIDSSGYRRAGTATLTGTTPVTLPFPTTQRVVDVYTSTALATVGTVTIADSDGNTLAQWMPATTRSTYPIIELYETPDSAFSLNARVDLNPTTLALVEGIIPIECTEILVLGTMMREYQKREKFDLASRIETQMEKKIGRLVLDLAAKAELEAEEEVQFSHLGPYFPAGS